MRTPEKDRERRKEISKIFADNINRLRLREGISWRRLSEETGITRNFYTSNVNQNKCANLFTCFILADYFDVSIDFCLTDRRSQPLHAKRAYK